VANFRYDLQEYWRVREERASGHRLTFTRHLSVFLVPMIKTKPPRYQILIERSITAHGFGTEKHYAIDSRTNARVVKCRNQESEKIAACLNAGAKFRW
jgi:hypothetical protein